MTPSCESLQDKDREALLCYRFARCLSTPPTPQLGESLSAVHGSAFSGHKLEVTVHTELGLFRKCFFRKNVGWGFLDLTASSLSALSKLIRVYLLPTAGHLGHTWTLTNVNKAARDACRVPCNLSQHRRVWDHRAQQLRTRLSREKLPFNLAVPSVHILTGLPP